MRPKLIIFLLLCCCLAQAQKEGQALADSLLSALPNAVTDRKRASILNDVTDFYRNVNTDSAFKYAALGMRIVNRMKWDKGIAVFNLNYGNIYSSKEQLDSSSQCFFRALGIFKKLRDTVNMAIVYNDLGTIAKEKSDFVAATQYFMNTLQIGLDLKNNFTIGLASENLALVYEYQEDYVNGLKYARQSVIEYGLSNNEEKAATPLALTGDIYLRLKQYDSAYYYLQQAVSLARRSGNKAQEGSILNYIAEYYANQEDYYSALKYGMEGKKIWDTVGPVLEDAINNTGIIGYYYLQLAKQTHHAKPPSPEIPASKDKLLQLAMTYLEDAVQKSKATGNKTAQSEFQVSLADANALAGNYEEAYLNYKTYKEINDSVYSQENKNKIAAAVNQRELDKKNDEIAINKLTIGNQQRQRVFLVTGIFLLAVIGGLLYWQSRTRKNTNNVLLSLNNELHEANAVKAKFFGILSHDLRSPVASLINLLQVQKRKPGIMSEEQVADRENKISDSAKLLLETMEAVLLWSKGQMEHFKPFFSPVPVNSLFDHLQRFFAGSANITFVFSNEDDLHLSTDENYLQTIMYNLTANSIKALRLNDKGRIAWKAWQENGNTLLSITDNGAGTDDEQLKALYDETASSGARSGLGLHIIRDLAKAIGCTVTLRSGKGAGTEFILCIPGNMQ